MNNKISIQNCWGKVCLNYLLPVGRYINMDPYPHRVAYILDLVHLFWTILFLLNLDEPATQLYSIIANNIQLKKCPVKILR